MLAIASSHDEIIRTAARLYNDRDVDGYVDRFSADAKLRTLLDGEVQGREAIRDWAQRQWEEVDSRFEVLDIEDSGERQAIVSAAFTVSTRGLEQRQALTFLFSFTGGEEKRIAAIGVFGTPAEASKAASREADVAGRP